MVAGASSETNQSRLTPPANLWLNCQQFRLQWWYVVIWKICQSFSHDIMTKAIQWCLLGGWQHFLGNNNYLTGGTGVVASGCIGLELVVFLHWCSSWLCCLVKKIKIKGCLKPACHFIDDVFSIYWINLGKDTRAMMVNLTTPLVDKDGELVMSFFPTLMFSGVDTD